MAVSGGPTGCGGAAVDVVPGIGNGNGETASLKSWALKTQESYQLQLALALRLSSQASSAEDPNFLDFNANNTLHHGVDSESLSHRFWVSSLIYLCF